MVRYGELQGLGCTMREARESPDFVFGILAFVILVGLALLSIGLGAPPAGVEPAIFGSP
jgi:hypothetical protein